MNPYTRMSWTRASLLANATAAALTWGIYALDTSAWPGIALPAVVTALAAANLVVTRVNPHAKARIVRELQRRGMNPLVKALHRIGLNPLGIALLETTGRRSGRARVVPVGVRRDGRELWFIAEHGDQAGYVRNLIHQPRVRVKLRRGLTHRWHPGVAEVRREQDPLARQRWIAGWHPLRMLNAGAVRILGAELLVVRVVLDSEPEPEHAVSDDDPGLGAGIARPAAAVASGSSPNDRVGAVSAEPRARRPLPPRPAAGRAAAPNPGRSRRGHERAGSAASPALDSAAAVPRAPTRPGPLR